MSPKYMAPGTPEEQADHAAKLEAAKQYERKQWAELTRIAERCRDIAEHVWGERLDEAEVEQMEIAELMRDRDYGDGASAEHSSAAPMDTIGEVPTVTSPGGGFVWQQTTYRDGSIPVPLFTPRDRLQFLKEVAATLLISADRRNLTVQFPKDDHETEENAPEAASGADENDPAEEDANPADSPSFAVPQAP